MFKTILSALTKEIKIFSKTKETLHRFKICFFYFSWQVFSSKPLTVLLTRTFPVLYGSGQGLFFCLLTKAVILMTLPSRRTVQRKCPT